MSAANTRCLVALGGNVGNVAETFETALGELTAGSTDCQSVLLGRISTNFSTPAVGSQAGGGFLNAAAEVVTTLSPLELLRRLQEIEASHGRDRRRKAEGGRRKAERQEGRIVSQRPVGPSSLIPHPSSFIPHPSSLITVGAPARSQDPTAWGPRTLDLDLILYGDQVIDTPELHVPHPACWYRRFVLDPLVEIAADTIHPVKQASFGELRSRLLPRPLTVAFTGGTPEQRAELARRLRDEFPAATFDPDWSGGELPALLPWLGHGPLPEKDVAFDSLPLLPRLDASTADDPLAFLRSVVQAALGE